MAENDQITPQPFEIDELDDAALEEVAGGLETNNCTNTNCAGANCVAGCGGGGGSES
ncbi:MAG: hypothetical protein ACJ76J_06715 [Thermoanaerobaculia bacterium]